MKLLLVCASILGKQNVSNNARRANARVVRWGWCCMNLVWITCTIRSAASGVRLCCCCCCCCSVLLCWRVIAIWSRAKLNRRLRLPSMMHKYTKTNSSHTKKGSLFLCNFNDSGVLSWFFEEATNVSGRLGLRRLFASWCLKDVILLLILFPLCEVKFQPYFDLLHNLILIHSKAIIPRLILRSWIRILAYAPNEHQSTLLSEWCDVSRLILWKNKFFVRRHLKQVEVVRLWLSSFLIAATSQLSERRRRPTPNAGTLQARRKDRRWGWWRVLYCTKQQHHQRCLHNRCQHEEAARLTNIDSFNFFQNSKLPSSWGEPLIFKIKIF